MDFHPVALPSQGRLSRYQESGVASLSNVSCLSNVRSQHTQQRLAGTFSDDSPAIPSQLQAKQGSGPEAYGELHPAQPDIQ